MPKTVALQAQEQDVAVSGKTKRILALDLIRGYFLMVIMINHVELYPNGFDLFTGKGRLFVSAAEGFFFMSGLLIGMVYKRRIQLGMKFIFRKMWKRTVQLYVGSVITTLLFAFWAVSTHHTAIKDGLPNPMNWHWVIKETLLLRFGYGWTDFLMRFTILMIFAPFVFYLAAKRKWWVALAGILIAWAIRGQNFTLGWQLIFNGGILIGFYWQQLSDFYSRMKPKAKNWLKGAVIGVTAVSFTYSYASVYLQSLLNHIDTHLPLWLQSFTFHWNSFNDWIWLYAQKWTMGPVRVLLFFCWFAILFALVRRYETAINRRSRGVFELLGRNSLYVYIAHSFIIFGLKFFIPGQTNFLQNFLFTGFGVVLLIIATVAYRLMMTNPLPTTLPELRQLLSKSKALLDGSG